MSHIVRLSDFRRRRGRVYFTRSELSQLLTLYSGRVASGEWKDYAIDHAIGIAVFSIFRHSQDRPVYAIAKQVGPRGADYEVFDSKGKINRAVSLNEALAVFEREPALTE